MNKAYYNLNEMILKQNCYILSEAEQNALETDTYTSPSKITYTGSSIQRRNKVTEQISLKEKKERKKTDTVIDHQLSAKSKAKIRQKIIAWSNCIPKHQQVKFSFVTLTLTSKQIGSDKAFTKMLNVFFTYLRKYVKGFKNYLFVLERQQNGNIHAHIITSHFLPILLLNRVWCKVLSDHGYTYNQNGKTVSPMQALLNRVKDKSLSTPSPVDISCVYDLKRVSSYVTKYITKNSTTMQTSIWNCSQSISKLWTGARISAKKYVQGLEQFSKNRIEKILDNGQKLYIHILERYTGLQKRIFYDINSQYLFS